MEWIQEKVWDLKDLAHRPRKKDVCWTVRLEYRHCWHWPEGSPPAITISLKSRDHWGDCTTERCLQEVLDYNSPDPCVKCKLVEWWKTLPGRPGSREVVLAKREEFEKECKEEVADLIFRSNYFWQLWRSIKPEKKRSGSEEERGKEPDENSEMEELEWKSFSTVSLGETEKRNGNNSSQELRIPLKREM
ncbi:hypothetical protein PG996_000072 [Apiospora saccharicola]|uniref:Uncharacterized protein n=1 Tax=Apiospora saccharicola TaxID=335842 RepID=A0ABR1WFK0_9PEZI